MNVIEFLHDLETHLIQHAQSHLDEAAPTGIKDLNRQHVVEFLRQEAAKHAETEHLEAMLTEMIGEDVE